MRKLLMCGRLNIIDDPLCQIVSDTLGIKFYSKSNDNLCPSEAVATIVHQENRLLQADMQWGIQPSWSKRLLINAQSESVAKKTTFAQAFAIGRCLVPCSGWYEWRKEGSNKQKLYFSHKYQQPIYMADICYYQQDAPSKVVTLTTQPNQLCGQFHHRMPVLITPENITAWFNQNLDELQRLMLPLEQDILRVTAA